MRQDTQNRIEDVANELHVDEKVLHRLDLAVRRECTLEGIQDVNLGVWADGFGRTIVVELRVNIWSEKLATNQVFHPDDWWEAFKDRWFPRWYLDRWPVKYRVHIFDMRALFPEYRAPHPSLGPHVLRILHSESMTTGR